MSLFSFKLNNVFSINKPFTRIDREFSISVDIMNSASWGWWSVAIGGKDDWWEDWWRMMMHSDIVMTDGWCMKDHSDDWWLRMNDDGWLIVDDEWWWRMMDDWSLMMNDADDDEWWCMMQIVRPDQESWKLSHHAIKRIRMTAWNNFQFEAIISLQISMPLKPW